MRAFFVHPDFARRGIGSEIMRLCEEAIVATGFSHVKIGATLTGEKLYERFGYEVSDRYEVELSNGATLPVVEMTKSIG